ncbi:Eco57I restriction-modification methylase domain-containing protein [uncultured Draconibacterium sp.]|uniref:Eco57I restriction-modification methylase domain-containing protein n=1 Tax=uncultured Draconibacterium sp. TaxID=1573823 RepID=UPI003216E283
MKNSFREIFKKKYKRKRWQSVLIQIMGDDKISYHLSPSSVELTETQLKKVHEVLNIGTIQTSDNKELPIFEVHLNKNVVIERNRVTVNEIIKQHLIKDARDGAVAVYYYPNYNKTEWRFSFISPGTENSFFEELEVESTNSKRFTYVFGVAEEEHRTAAQQFSVLAESKKTLDDFYEAFNVEKMSKQFFDDYKEHYDLFNDYLLNSKFKISAFNANEKTVRDFVKKLLGRVIFIYFIQKKGWLGASTTDYVDGDKNFLQNFFNQAKKKTFYSNWLSKLFFETLNKQRENDDFEMPDGSKIKIPFLNGGLFDKVSDKYDWITFPVERFEELFKFLNRYNFTIYEDSPEDHTVAVDPEMLGHIFENLLEDNKDKGAFYTPKEIVQYMTQESLIEYLHTHLPHIDKNHLTLLVKYKTLGDIFELKDNIDDIDHLLDKVKICDPAIGSGAFPMGLLQEIFALKDLLIHEKGYDFKDKAKVKEHIIQNSIYGVDIEQGAVDIARLRFWLSLVVYEDIPKPLPNLDFKIVVGDSLRTKFEDQVMHIDWDVKSAKTGKMIAAQIRKELQNLSQKQKKYFESSEKSKLKKEIRELKLDIIEKQLRFNQKKYQEYNSVQGNVWEGKLKRTKKQQVEVQNFGILLNKIATLRKNPDRELQFFDWKLNFPEILNPNIAGDNTGFDIVIGNPPYISANKLKIQLGKESYEHLKSLYVTSKGTIDIYILFYELSINILKNEGALAFITPNRYLSASYGKALREFFYSNTIIQSIADFSSIKVFKNASTYPIVTILKKNSNKQKSKIVIRKYKSLREKPIKWLAPAQDLTLLPDYLWGFLINDKIEIVKRILNQSIRLESAGKINATSTAKEADEMHILINESKGLKLINTGTIDRYSNTWGMELLTDKGEKYLNPKIDVDSPIVTSNRTKLYQSPKLIIAKIALRAEVFYDKEGEYSSINTNCIHSFSDNFLPEYILAWINSRLYHYMFECFFDGLRMSGGYLLFSAPNVRNTYIKAIDKDLQLPFKIISEYISTLLFTNSIINDFVPNQHVANIFDELLDAMFYELYFPNEFQQADIEFSRFVERDFIPIEGLAENEKKQVIHKAYQKLRDKHNEIRNNLILMDIRLAEIVMPIKSA